MAWHHIAQAQDGVVSRAQLLGAGVGPTAIRRLEASGALVRLSRGVYLVRGAPWTYRARLWAAVVTTDGVLGFATAAHLWGVEPEPPLLVDIVLAPQRTATALHGVRIHRVFTPCAATTTRDLLPVTTRRQTLLDHLGRLPEAQAQRLVDRAIQRSWLGADDLTRRLRNYPGRQGNAMLRRVAAVASDGAAAESERRLHRLLRRAGITDWSANHPVWCNGELVAVIDVALPRIRLAIEVDGMAYHSDVDRFQRDRSRQNTLEALGWTVLRFTWADLTQRPGYVIAAIRDRCCGLQADG